MKKVVITIIGFAIAIGLIVGVIIPIAEHGRETGVTAETRYNSVEDSVEDLASPIH